LAAGALFLGVLTLSGCGPDYKARAAVKGKVTMGKMPLPNGTIMFYGSSGVTASAVIEDGNYNMPDAPIGDVTITIVVPAAPPPVPGGLKGQVEKWKKTAGGNSNDPSGENSGIMFSKMPTTSIKIEDKYAKPDTSPLKFKVERGEQTHNIEL
jgi:hypothetical protein